MIKLISCLKNGHAARGDAAVFGGLSQHGFRGIYGVGGSIKSHRESIVNQISSLQQIVDFIDIKLKEGDLARNVQNKVKVRL